MDLHFRECERTGGAFDRNGALYYLATDAGRIPYANPHSTERVIASKADGDGAESFTASPGKVCAFVQHAMVDADTGNDYEVWNSVGGVGAWMAVSLCGDFSLVPNHYCLRDDYQGWALRSWDLDGAEAEHLPDPADDVAWRTLHRARGDMSLEHATGSSQADWRLDEAAVEGIAFRHFRVRLRGASSHDNMYLRCAGIELYGRLFGGGGCRAVPAPEEVVETVVEQVEAVALASAAAPPLPPAAAATAAPAPASSTAIVADAGAGTVGIAAPRANSSSSSSSSSRSDSDIENE